VEGVAIVDGTMMGTEDLEALVQEPFEMRFEKGRVVSISGGSDARRLENLLKTLAPQARTFAELGVNSNFIVPKKLRGSRLDMAGEINGVTSSYVIIFSTRIHICV
jgi:leucyl aminopeptidase (aminopeptidase T)